MPQYHIDELSDIVRREKNENIRGKYFEQIFKKLQLNGLTFDRKQSALHQQCLKLIWDKYLFEHVHNKHTMLHLKG